MKESRATVFYRQGEKQRTMEMIDRSLGNMYSIIFPVAITSTMDFHGKNTRGKFSLTHQGDIYLYLSSNQNWNWKADAIVTKACKEAGLKFVTLSFGE